MDKESLEIFFDELKKLPNWEEMTAGQVSDFFDTLVRKEYDCKHDCNVCEFKDLKGLI